MQRAREAHIVMLVRSEAQHPQQAVCGQPHALCKDVHHERLVHPAQGLPEVGHEFHIWIPALRKGHPILALDPVHIPIDY